MAGGAEGFPIHAGRRDGGLIIAIEDDDRQPEVLDSGGAGAIDEEYRVGAVRIVDAGGEPQGLQLARTVGLAAMGQERLIVIGPEQTGELLDALLGEEDDRSVRSFARRIGAPIIATNDSHYVHRDDHEAHDALLCVQTGAALSDPKRFKFEGQEHYLKKCFVYIASDDIVKKFSAGDYAIKSNRAKSDCIGNSN